jgi:hypothetical protein
MNAKALVSGPLLEAELDQLSVFVAVLHSPDALTLEGMNGLFSALIAGPQTVRQQVPATDLRLAYF